MRPKTTLPMCVKCLYAIGWGVKRIMRHTGYAKTTVRRFAVVHGILPADAGEQKKAQFNARKKRISAEREARMASEHEQRRLLRDMTPRPSREEINKKMMACYYKNHEKNKAKRAAIARSLYIQEIEYRNHTGIIHPRTLRRLLRARIHNAIVRGGRRSSRSDRKAMPTHELIGCDVHQLRTHIERQFRDGMSWLNYGDWEIDHIKPCASFDLSQPEQQRQCFHYTNLQPLWREENRRKWASVVPFCTTPTPFGSLLKATIGEKGPRSRVSFL